MTPHSQQVQVTDTNKIVSITRKEFATPVVFIQWFVGIRCQYDCQYCSTEWHDKTSPHWTLEQLQQAWHNLCNANSHRPGIRFNIAITGGEPTMNPDFLPWVKWLKETQSDRILRVNVSTNSTRKAEYYNELSHCVNEIIFSAHSEYLIEKRFFKLVEDVNRYTKKNNTATVVVFLPQEYWHINRVNEYASYLSKKGIRYKLSALHDFNPDKQPRPVRFYNKMDFNEPNTNS